VGLQQKEGGTDGKKEGKKEETGQEEKEDRTI
jgi:hypothetical protein